MSVGFSSISDFFWQTSEFYLASVPFIGELDKITTCWDIQNQLENSSEIENVKYQISNEIKFSISAKWIQSALKVAFLFVFFLAVGPIPSIIAILIEICMKGYTTYQRNEILVKVHAFNSINGK